MTKFFFWGGGILESLCLSVCPDFVKTVPHESLIILAELGMVVYYEVACHAEKLVGY